MTPHLRYLRYVLLHKWYVLRAGIVVGGWSLPWLWRLLVHDLSKFSRAEWTPYVVNFYKPSPEVECPRCRRQPDSWKVSAPPVCGDCGHRLTPAEFQHENARVLAEMKDCVRRYKAAWLHHIHANPHHWQHWLLHQDDGKTIVLVPPGRVVNEMIADWMGAGRKINNWPTMQTCVAETIVWYANNARVMQLRQPVRDHVELVLHALASRYGLHYLIPQLNAASASRARVEVSRG